MRIHLPSRHWVYSLSPIHWYCPQFSNILSPLGYNKLHPDSGHSWKNWLLLFWEYLHLYAFLLWLSPFYCLNTTPLKISSLEHSNLIFLRNHLCIPKCPRKAENFINIYETILKGWNRKYVNLIGKKWGRNPWREDGFIGSGKQRHKYRCSKSQYMRMCYTLFSLGSWTENGNIHLYTLHITVKLISVSKILMKP